MKRPGYYVRGSYYAYRFAQARARAAFLAGEFGMCVPVVEINVEGTPSQRLLVTPSQSAMQLQPLRLVKPREHTG